MKLKNLLKLCSRNKFAATLFGILVITIISSMIFVQSVFGQNSIHQILETLQTSEVFSTAPETTIVMAAETTPVPAALPATVTATVTAAPTAAPTAVPTAEPTAVPTATPTPKPTSKPTTKPTVKQTQAATATAAAAVTVPPCSGSFDGGMASAVLDLTNQQRTGLCSLAWNDSLSATAQTRVKEIAVSFSHTRPDGSEWYTAGGQMAENIAKGQSSSGDVMASWMASAFHAANITNAAFTQMGAACYCADGTYYWVQEFS